MLIDSHCHLDSTAFDDADEVLARARSAGVSAFVVIGVAKTLDAARFAIRLAERHADVRAVVGVHPHDAAALSDAMLAELEDLARSPSVAAVGEMGLDYHYMSSPMEAQKEAFRRQIALARAARKPIVVHTRSAPEDTIAILAEEGARDVGGVIHCFSEDRPFAVKALDLGFDLSFSGIVTFKSASALREAAKIIPLTDMFIETDCPYLAPLPFRGKPNEPSYLPATASYLAQTLGCSVEEIAEQTSLNAIEFFQLT